MAERDDGRHRRLPVPTPRNERNDSIETNPDDDLYEEVTGSPSFQDGHRSHADVAFQSRHSSDNYNSQNSTREFSGQSDYVDCSEARRDVQYTYGYDYPRIQSDETTKKIKMFKDKPREYMSYFNSTNEELRADEETFIIVDLLKKDSKYPVLEGKLDQLADLACCNSSHVVKKALDALLNEIFLSISDTSRTRCFNILKAEEILRESIPTFLKTDNFKAKCQRITTYAWLVTLVLLKCSKEECIQIQQKIREFDKTLYSLQNDRENNEQNLFRYGIYVAREAIARIAHTSRRKDTRDSLVGNIKKCENILNCSLTRKEVMKLGKALSNSESWLDLHICLVFLQDLPKLYQYDGNQKPVILIQMLIEDYRLRCSGVRIRDILPFRNLNNTLRYKWQFEILVYRVMLRLIRTSTNNEIIDQVLTGEQGCGGVLRKWIVNKTEPLNDEVVVMFLKKICEKAVFYANTLSIFKPFLEHHSKSGERRFIENVSLLWLSSAYKDKVLEILPESRVPLREYCVLSYGASMSGRKCLVKLYYHSIEDILRKDAISPVHLQEEIKILKILNAVEKPCPNIVRLLGSRVEIPMHMIIERTPSGNLLSYLQGLSNPPEANDLFKIAQDICDAMNFLGDHDIIHRNLCAKSCFVFMQGQKVRLTKLGDFQLAVLSYADPKSPTIRDRRQAPVKLQVNDDVLKKIAVRWAAVEALKFGEFSPASDVWSFGVLLSEIFTYGCVPYVNMPNGMSLKLDEDVREFVLGNNKLELHPKIPESVHTLIELTMVDADHRATFPELKDNLLLVNFTDGYLYHDPAHFKIVHCNSGKVAHQPMINPSTGCNVKDCFGECRTESDIATPLSVESRPGNYIREFIPTLQRSTDILKLSELKHPTLAVIAERRIHAVTMELITEVGDMGSFEEFIKMFGCSVENAMTYVSQIGRAMLFLHSRIFIHRNLRAASVYIYSSGNAKLACFARTKQLKPNPEEYFSTIPVTLPMADDSLRWSSPEVISSGQYNKCSDIWAFGVMAWEIFTLIDEERSDGDDQISHLPYHPLETKEQILSFLRAKRLGKPESCPDWLYSLMLKCWEHNTRDRLKCQDIVHCIEKQAISTTEEIEDEEGK